VIDDHPRGVSDGLGFPLVMSVSYFYYVDGPAVSLVCYECYRVCLAM